MAEKRRGSVRLGLAADRNPNDAMCRCSRCRAICLRFPSGAGESGIPGENTRPVLRYVRRRSTVGSRRAIGVPRESLSCARVMLQVQCLEAFPRDVRVYLSSADVGVTEQHLDDPKVGAMIQQVSSEGMPQGMRR